MSSLPVGPWALVTGASSGIGRAIASELAGAGLSIVLVARREAELDALAAMLPTDAHVVAADLTDPAAMPRLLDAIGDREIGTVVHAAGFGLGGPHLNAAPDALAAHRRMLTLNCGVALDLVQHFVPAMTERGRGSFVFLGSAIGFSGVPGSAHYAATKAWCIHFAEGLQRELAPSGVDVLAVCPGPTDTEFFAEAGMVASAASSPEAVARTTVARLRRRRAGVSIPDWLGWSIAWSLATVPRWMRVRIMEQVMGGMTRNADAPGALTAAKRR